jgi:hypothetical protein
MTDSTNARSAAIQAAAQRILVDSGVDISGEINVQPLARKLANEANCNYATAKRHIIKAVNLAKGIPLPVRNGPRGDGFPTGLKRQDRRGKAVID